MHHMLYLSLAVPLFHMYSQMLKGSKVKNLQSDIEYMESAFFANCLK